MAEIKGKKLSVDEKLELIINQLENTTLYLTETERRTLDKRLVELHKKLDEKEDSKLVKAIKKAIKQLAKSSKKLNKEAKSEFDNLKRKLKEYKKTRFLKQQEKLNAKKEKYGL